jgi:hypothetical protein
MEVPIATLFFLGPTAMEVPIATLFFLGQTAREVPIATLFLFLSSYINLMENL